MSKLKDIDLTKKKSVSFKPVVAPPVLATPEVNKIDKPLPISQQSFIDENIKQWRQTIKNDKQLQELIRVRFEEQTSEEWTIKHIEYFVNMINRVI